MYNGLSDLLKSIPQSAVIRITTGLGVDHARLAKQINKIQHIKNLKIVVSAENINEGYEFNRYGNTYNKFEKNLKLLFNSGVTVEFNSVVSNLTIFGLIQFVDKYNYIPINYDFCCDPDYLGVNVLDNDSKQKLSRAIENSSISIKDAIIQSMSKNCTNAQRKNYSIFLKEFAQRRNLDLDIFPDSMLEWLNHVV